MVKKQTVSRVILFGWRLYYAEKYWTDSIRSTAAERQELWKVSAKIKGIPASKQGQTFSEF